MEQQGGASEGGDESGGKRLAQETVPSAGRDGVKQTVTSSGFKLNAVGNTVVYDSASGGPGSESLKTIFLHVETGPSVGRIFAIEGKSAVLGRSESVDIWLPDPSVSRQHAHVRRVGTAIFVEDLASQNGTYVEGERVVGESEVFLGQRIAVGNATLYVSESPLRSRLEWRRLRRPRVVFAIAGSALLLCVGGWLLRRPSPASRAATAGRRDVDSTRRQVAATSGAAVRPGAVQPPPRSETLVGSGKGRVPSLVAQGAEPRDSGLALPAAPTNGEPERPAVATVESDSGAEFDGSVRLARHGGAGLPLPLQQVQPSAPPEAMPLMYTVERPLPADVSPAKLQRKRERPRPSGKPGKAGAHDTANWADFELESVQTHPPKHSKRGRADAGVPWRDFFRRAASSDPP